MKNSIDLKPWGVKKEETLDHYRYFWSSTLIGIQKELRHLAFDFFETKKQHVLLSQDDTRALVRDIKLKGSCIASGFSDPEGKKTKGVPYPDPLPISDLKTKLNKNCMEIISEIEEDYVDLHHCFCLTYKANCFFILLFSRKNMAIVALTVVNGCLFAELAIDYDIVMQATEKDETKVAKFFPYDLTQTHTKKVNMMFNSFMHAIWMNIAIGSIANAADPQANKGKTKKLSKKAKRKSFVKYGMQYGPKCGKCIECLDKSRKKMCVVRASRREEERSRAMEIKDDDDEEENGDEGSMSDSSGPSLGPDEGQPTIQETWNKNKRARENEDESQSKKQKN
jgi:hypothetical protein